jgi:uncharacterized lipoprotein YmbA
VKGFHLRIALVWLAIVGVGCASAPVRYYTLIPPPDKNFAPSETTLAIDVRVVHTPPQLERSELMVRTGPTEMTLLENERWASPVDDEIKGAVRLELQRRLAISKLRPAFTKLTLDVDVQQLEAEFGRYALLQASWSATLTVRDPRSTGTRARSCTFRAIEEINASYAGIVAGYQREIAALADDIAAVLTGAETEIGVPCQISPVASADSSGPKDN